MKLTKQKEIEILEAYDRFWVANLSANMELFTSYLVDDFSIIGSANGETFFSKAEAVAFYTATADQLKDKAQLRNRSKSIQPLDENSVIIRELCDLYVLIDKDWTFYGHARISCIVKKINNEWKALHQHTSFPDHRTEEGQQIAAEKIEKENLELREAVHRRTIELENKNRELEIEAAVEKVRAQSMAMQQTDDIAKVNEELFTQISKLNIDGFTGVAIYLVDEEGMVTVWDLSSPGNMNDVNSNAFKYDPIKTPTLSEFIPIWRAAAEDYFIMDYPKERLLTAADELEPFYPAMAASFRTAISSGALQHQWNATGRISHGILSLDMMKSPTEEVRPITLKMAAAFNFAYQRFHDLQKAEAQTRAAQIELAVERVRAKALAMHHSPQILDVVTTLRNEMLSLEIPGVVAATIYLQEEDGYIRMWDLSSVTEKDDGFHVALDVKFKPEETDPGLFIRRVWNNNENYFVEKQEAKDMVITLDWLRQYYPDQADEVQQFLDTTPWKYLLHPTIQLEHGKMSVDILDTQPPADMESILVKMGAAFDLAYKRFIDLQRSEIQIREGQIELALERVRARTMAMQHSDELLETATQLFQQIEALGAPAWNCSFNIWLEDKKRANAWNGTKNGFGRPFTTNSSEDVFYRFFEADQKGEELYVEEIGGPALKQHYDYLATVPGVGQTLKELKEAGIALPLYQVFNIAYFSQGYLMFITYEPVPQLWDVFKRFAKVFEQTYSRFLDLQKAEAQTREAKIEAALEKVRSRSLAMHKSDELNDVVAVLFERLKELQIPVTAAGIHIYIEGSKDLTVYVCGDIGNGLAINNYILPYFDHPIANDLYDVREKGFDFFVGNYSREEKNSFYKYVFEHSALKHLPDDIKNMILQSQSYSITMAPVKNSMISVNDFEGKHLSENEADVLKRFAKVFEQAYIRFLDLQKAEAQAREAQIEAALEKVRAVALSLRKSDEMLDVAKVLYEQLLLLGFADIRNAIIDIHDDKTETFLDYDYSHEMSGTVTRMSYYDDSFIEEQVRKIESSHDAFFELVLEGERLQSLIDLRIKNGEKPDPRLLKIDQLTYNLYSFGNGAIGISNFGVLKVEQKKILNRFRNVFTFAYKRYSDLAQAEAQAREAQVEAALERVRTRTMGMHKSDELLDVIKVISDQLVELKIKFHFVSFGINSEDQEFDFWLASPDFVSSERMHVPYMDNPIPNTVIAAKKQGLSFFSNIFTGEENRAWLQLVLDSNKSTQIPETTRGFLLNSPGFARSAVILKNIFIFLGNYIPKPYTDEENDILIRFGKVFEQTYTRFLDLQKAEANAKEAIIEASLERVRAKAMAMHSSKDLADTIQLFYKEMKLLSLTPRRCGVCLVYKETQSVHLMNMNTNEQGESFEAEGNVKLSGHRVLEEVYNNWLKQKEYHPVLRGNELREYYKVVRTQMSSYPEYLYDESQYGYFFYFPEGSIYAWTEKELPEADLQIYRRFTSVLSLTYKRFKDLQKAEANAQATVKQAALDRIRADIASMRTTKDLERITPLIWNELTILGIPFIRCGVFIMDEEKQLIHTFLSTPDGKSIGAFHIPYATPGNISQVLSNWYKKKNYCDHWDEDEFLRFADILVKQEAIASPEQYLKAIPQGGFYLHFLPFLQGMLYVGNTTELNDGEIHLIQSIADAFSTAYARYEDFNKLEAAKNQVDSTLIELQSTQKQLIQSEKMASLGELTAGIAHEIQNPLNFVNNFSEVSKELLDEMREAIEKGDAEEAKEIMNDVIQNLEKINHHGKRADAIVKGMLQHSRSSSSIKEPTDINALADEYLRLAYHGLRAKDKSFNATMKTDFDESIGNINIIPQDIGRVILNLITNAFYAAPLPPEGGFPDPDYKHSPTVWVRTKKMGDKVFISVRDNGPGIPKKILDKIFQPFFTTKPTGRGTGLGLSLAYDIVKAHGGELKVETKEGEGSEFIIQLSLID